MGEVSGAPCRAGRASGCVLGRFASLARGVRIDISQRTECYRSAGRWISIGLLRDIPQLSPQAAWSLARFGAQRSPSFACLPVLARHRCHETAVMTA